MTLPEFLELCEAYDYYRMEQYELLAWHAAKVSEPHVGRAISPKDLFDKEYIIEKIRLEERPKLGPEEMKRRFEEIARRREAATGGASGWTSAD